jgi:8-oxo-dGTP pyrophosphatase MutT (NUDIX family)
MPKPLEIEVIARGLVRHGQYLLACINTAKGYYYLPGGHVESNETAATALAREIAEETGKSAQIGSLLFACEVIFNDGKRPHHEYNLVFHVELKERHRSSTPPAVKSKETGIAFGWFDQAAILDLDLRPAAIRAWLASGCTPGPDPIGWASSRD